MFIHASFMNFFWFYGYKLCNSKWYIFPQSSRYWFSWWANAAFNFSACVFVFSYSLWLAKGGAVHRGVSTLCNKPIWANQGIVWLCIMFLSVQNLNILDSRLLAWLHSSVLRPCHTWYIYETIEFCFNTWCPTLEHLSDTPSYFCLFSSLLKKYAVIYTDQIRNGKLYCSDTLIRLVHILVVILAKILVEYQTTLCPLCNK